MSNKQEIINGLEHHRQRLIDDVFQAFKTRGSSFGNERFSAWRERLSKFLDENLPGESEKLSSRLYRIFSATRPGESHEETFWRQDGDKAKSFIDSLLVDIQRDEYLLKSRPAVSTVPEKNNTQNISNQVFIVHGHDESIKSQTARFIEKLGFKAIILDEQANGGKTVIEKIESNTNVGFAIVLYSPDDSGNTKAKANNSVLNLRARQNVIFEHGYLIAKLSRERVVPLISDEEIELPSDINGMVYISDRNWQMDIAREMKNVGYEVDLNKII
ncbi:MAG: TIR domain-containing protein [Methylococcaceae bacterium]